MEAEVEEQKYQKINVLNNIQKGIQIHRLIWWINLLLQNTKKCNPIKELKQEVGDDLSVGVLNILPKINSLPSLLHINLVKVEIWSCDLMLVKGLCLGASCVVSIHSLQVDICILFVTVKISLIYMSDHPEKFGDHRHSDN